MNNDLERFEEILKELKPMPLSQETKAAIEKLPEDVPVERKASGPIPFRRLVWAAAAIVIVVLVLKFAGQSSLTEPDTSGGIAQDDRPAPEHVVIRKEPKPKPAPEEIRSAPGPFTMDELITAIHDEGIVEPEDGPPVRKLRREYIRVLNIRDPRTGKRYKVQKPVSDVMYVPLEQY